LTFLAEAERLFGPDGGWLSEVHALRGKVFQSLREFNKAEAEYRAALRLEPTNRRAQEGMTDLGVPLIPEAP
jgi:Flp pilus assembly protein TadD